MKWTRYGITLCKLTENHLEMVRYWRNHPEVSKYMEYRQYITPEMQQDWFKKVNTEQHYYFIIEYDKREIGLISTSDINYITKTGNCGIFVWDVVCTGSHVPVFAVLSMLDFVFLILDLEYTIIKVHSKNKKAIAYNRSLGYELLPGEEKKEFRLYRLNKEGYFMKTMLLRNLGKKLYGNATGLYLDGDSSLQKMIQKLPDVALKELNITYAMQQS